MEFRSEIIHKLLDMGCCVEYYTFGVEGIYTPYFNLPQNTPTDRQRIQDITELIDEGYIEMKNLGMNDEQIDMLLIENTKRLLALPE